MKIEGDVLRTLGYFAVFKYPPSLEQLHQFLSLKVSKAELQKTVRELMKKKKIEALEVDAMRYCKKGDSQFFEQFQQHSLPSLNKMVAVSWFFRILRILPAIEFAGISGSLSMMNAGKKDDIDICIITAPGRLWTGRLIANIVAIMLGKKRFFHDPHPENKLCLNLFFDASDVVIPKEKQNEYVAHEVLQMLPVVNKYDAYQRFLQQNEWIKDIFPNSHIPKVIVDPTYEIIGAIPLLRNISEQVAKRVQLISIEKRKTKEYITENQLWFFPDDFEKKIKKKFPDLRFLKK